MKAPAVGQQDQQHIARLEHLHTAIRNPAEITSCLPFQGALTETSVRTERAINALKHAVEAAANDATENKTVAIAFHNCALAAIEEYTWLRAAAQSAASTPRPTRRRTRSDDQTFEIHAIAERAFSVPPSDLDDMGAVAFLRQLNNTLDLLPKLSAILPADDIRAFTDAFSDLKAARQRVTDEALDDAPLMETLRAARVHAAGVLVASRSMLDSILRFENSPTDVDTFILRRKESADSKEPTTPTTEV